MYRHSLTLQQSQQVRKARRRVGEGRGGEVKRGGEGRRRRRREGRGRRGGEGRRRRWEERGGREEEGR